MAVICCGWAHRPNALLFLKSSAMKRMLIGLFLFAGLWYNTALYAQSREELLEQILENDRGDVESLMLYPEATRLHILEAAKYPEALIRLQTLQRRTQAAFRTLVENYPENVQRQIWDLTRYPNLVQYLVAEGRGNTLAFQRILQNFPPEAQQAGMELAAVHFDLLVRVDVLDRDAQEAFDRMAGDYPERTRAALRTLLDEPEALGILTDNIRMAVLLGDLYQREPYWMIQQAEQIGLEAARQRAKDLESWKQSLQDDPDALRDFEQSAQAYADEYRYDDEYYNYSRVPSPNRVAVERHYYYNYPYWFGYPSWYNFPRWRPLPYWYDWGFYPRPGGTVVIFNFPSTWFVNWYFRRPVYIYQYPYLAGRFADYYYGHRRSTCSVVLGVDRWRVRNAAVVQDNWLSDRDGRIDRLREFGRMESSRELYNRDNPRQPLNQREFVERKATDFPRLNERLPERPQPATPRSTDPRRNIPAEPTRPVTPPTKVPTAEPRKEAPRPATPPAKAPTAEPRKEIPRPATPPAKAPTAQPRKDTPRPATPPAKAPTAEPRKDTPRPATPPAKAPTAQPRKEAPRPTTPPTKKTGEKSKEPVKQKNDRG